jgi:hypothetical protein
MMMSSPVGTRPIVYTPPVRTAQVPSSTEEATEPQPPSTEASGLQGTKPPSEGSSPTSSRIPSTTIEENTERTFSDGNGDPILSESSSRNTTINRTPPTLDLKLRRTSVYDNTTGRSNVTTEVGVKASTTGEGGSASVDLSDKTTVIDNIPVNTAIGRTDGHTCKLTQRTADGQVKKFEAPKPEDGNCIQGAVPLTPSNHIQDEKTKTIIVTQQREGLPTGVTIEYNQIPNSKK